MAKNKPVRIIFDTNWYISYLITGRPQQLDNILIDENYEIVISDKQEEEFEKVMNRPGNRKYFTINIARKYFSFIKKEVFIFHRKQP
jgi:predicted nucleic acid-binding protein